MKFYSADKDTVLKHVGSAPNGLTSEEAEKRLAENGKNKLAEGKKKTLLQRFVAQLIDPMIIVLLGAAALSFITEVVVEKSFPTDVFIILFVVILNAVLGVIQESKAEEAIAALSEMTAAQSKVMRNGIITHVKSEDLVIGDVIILEAGDSVPADARILECASLQIEEAALTGESVPVNKNEEILSDTDDVPLGDRKNMVYMGSTVVYGRGVAVICACGMDTEMGKIASALTNAKEEATPLQIKLNQLSKILTFLVLGICVLVFVVGLITANELSATALLDTFMLAISLAVAAIPEGLAAVVTIVLSIGVTKMSKRNAVIRKLTAVETLGCTQIICSDKTGTLTQNKMTVVDDYTPDKKLLATAMSLCTDAEVDTEGKVIGEPTEAALVQFAFKNGLPKYELKEAQPRINEAPFDSMRKMMSTVHQTGKGIIQYTKGAPDEILKKCTYILTESGVRPITDEDKEKILAENKRMAGKALRVLAAAYREYDDNPNDSSPENLEKELIFIGIVGMIDPVRPEVKDAIEQCKTAGIRAIMITGDHRDTAVAIAEELGILTDPSQAITGSDLNNMSDEELAAKIENYSVYARVQPEHKVRIVKAWKSLGKIVAMTGDGVNDAPSIKSADIGIGMGITGTDVTKNVADMILGDDNFATIVSAVEEGRKIYSNIRKSIQFLLSSNLSEVVAIFIATIFNFTILKPAHILWINLITDSLPALALGVESNEKDAMKQPPRSSTDGIFAGGVAYDVLYQGFVVAILTLTAYLLGCCLEDGVWAWNSAKEFFEWLKAPDGGHQQGITMAFLSLSMCEIFQSFNMRSRRGSIFTMKKQNVVLWGAAAAALALTTAVIYIPFFAKIFDFAHINAIEYFTALGLSILVIPIVECVKFIQRFVAKKKS